MHCQRDEGVLVWIKGMKSGHWFVLQEMWVQGVNL